MNIKSLVFINRNVLISEDCVAKVAGNYHENVRVGDTVGIPENVRALLRRHYNSKTSKRREGALTT